MNIYKKLIGNSVIFAIGNLGSKLIFFLLIPLYTYYLSVNEYGTIDLIATTLKMLLPIITVSIYEAVLRFVMDKNLDDSEVLTNSLIVTLFGVILSILIYMISKYLHLLDGLLEYILILLNLQLFSTLFAQFVRGIGKLKIFAINGIVSAFSIGVMSLFFLAFLNNGIQGYFLSIICGELISILFLIINAKIYRNINFKLFNKQLIKKMFLYSLPLIPNSFFWWVINASNRFLILFFVGISANGLFALASKIPSLLSILYNIFFQAWQLSAIEQFESNDKSKFFSNVFNYFSMILFLGTSILLVLLKTIFQIIASPEFYESWKYAPFLLIGVLFANFSGFLGANYIAAKKTNGIFKTSIVGGIVNVLSSLILVPVFGVIGASISTMLCFFVMWIVRIVDTKKIVDIHLNYKHIISNMTIIFIQILILYMNLNTLKELWIELILFAIILFINKGFIKNILRPVVNKLRERV